MFFRIIRLTAINKPFFSSMVTSGDIHGRRSDHCSGMLAVADDFPTGFRDTTAAGNLRGLAEHCRSEDGPVLNTN